MATRVLRIANAEKIAEIQRRKNKIEQLFQVKLVFTTKELDTDKHGVMVTGCRIDSQNAAMYIENLVDLNKPKSAFVFLNSLITGTMVENVEKQSVAVVYKEKGNRCLYRIKGSENQITLALDLLEEMNKEKMNSKHKRNASRRLSSSLQNSIVKSSRKVSNCVNASEKVKRAILGGLDSMEGTRKDDKENNVEVQDVILISDSEGEEEEKVFKDDIEEGEIDDTEDDVSLIIIDTPEPKRDAEARTNKNIYSDVIRKLTCEFQNMKSPSGADKSHRPVPVGKRNMHEIRRKEEVKAVRGGEDKSGSCYNVSNQRPDNDSGAKPFDILSETRVPISFNIKPLTSRYLIPNVHFLDQSEILKTKPCLLDDEEGKGDTQDKTENVPVVERKIKKAEKLSKKDDVKENKKSQDSNLEIPKDIAKDKLKKKKSKKRTSEEREKDKKRNKKDKYVESDPEPDEVEDSEKKGDKIRSKLHVRPEKDRTKSKRKNLRKPRVSETLRYIVIDGSNVAMSHGKNRVFSCKGLRMCVDFFKKRGHKLITIFLPMWRKCRPRDPSSMTHRYILDDLEDEGYLVYTPSRQIGNRLVASYDDRFILELADREDGIVVSNDQYRDLMYEKASWTKVIEERLLPYVFVNDNFMVPDDPLGRYGSNLDTFLRNTRYDRHVATKFQNEFKTLNMLTPAGNQWTCIENNNWTDYRKCTSPKVSRTSDVSEW